jgi:hypothetical protein
MLGDRRAIDDERYGSRMSGAGADGTVGWPGGWYRRGGEEGVEGRGGEGIDSFHAVPLVKRIIDLTLSSTALANTNKDKIRQ